MVPIGLWSIRTFDRYSPWQGESRAKEGLAVIQAESAEERIGCSNCRTGQFLQRYGPSLWGHAKRAAKSLNKGTRLAVSNRECDFLD